MFEKKPTIKELTRKIEQDFYARFEIEKPQKYSVIKVFSRVLAGGFYLLYSYIDYKIEQIFPDRATGIYLEKWARNHSVNRKPKNKSAGTAEFMGNNGAKIKAQTLIQSASDDSLQFIIVKDSTIENGKAIVELFAKEGGEKYNLNAGSKLQLISPISGIENEGIVSENGLNGGSELESIESWRERLLFKINHPPSGGVIGDYLNWIFEIPGVKKAWAFKRYPEAGSVGLAFTYSADINYQFFKDKVSNYIESKMPAAAELKIIDLKNKVINFKFKIRAEDNNTDFKNKVKTALETLINEEAAPKKTIEIFQIITSQLG